MCFSLQHRLSEIQESLNDNMQLCVGVCLTACRLLDQCDCTSLPHMHMILW